METIAAVGVAANVIQFVDFASRILKRLPDAQKADQLQSLQEITAQLEDFETASILGEDEVFRQCLLESRLALNTLANALGKLDDKGSVTKKWVGKLRRPLIQKRIDNTQQRLDVLMQEMQLLLLSHTKREAHNNRQEKEEGVPSYLDAEIPRIGEIVDEKVKPIIAEDLIFDEETDDTSSKIDSGLIDHSATGTSSGSYEHNQHGNAGLIQRLPHQPFRNEAHAFTVPKVLTEKATYRPLKALLEDVMIHKVTIYIVFAALIVGSAITAALAAWKVKTGQNKSISTGPLDSDFFGAISSNMGSILGTFCTIIPLIERNRQFQPDIAAWSPQVFRWLLVASVVAAILSMAVQTTDQASSLVFGYISTASQLIATLLLVVGSTHKITEHRRAYEHLSTNHLLLSHNLMNARRQAGATTVISTPT